MFIIKLLSQHVSGIVMPIIRRTRRCTTANAVLHWLCWLWLCQAGTRAVCTVHTSRVPAWHNNQCRTPYAAVHTLVLLMMGITMPETCWDKKFDNKHQISCILLVSLSSPWYVGVFNRVLQNELVVYCMCHRELKIFHNYFGVVSVALQRKLLKGVFSVQMSVRTA